MHKKGKRTPKGVKKERARARATWDRELTIAHKLRRKMHPKPKR